jgi:hypothetical protein
MTSRVPKFGVRSRASPVPNLISQRASSGGKNAVCLPGASPPEHKPKSRIIESTVDD